ncbi:uncharacterized protein LOC103718605 [Phoenix dactylifera]|uniref:Uncharacterized protein LOC103718605 n=1 Tax=Phoenix dactylifera TaxID=42345 RepID=A0A8B7CSW8_PHODC|nr:uncharacterized protein LOC103718605 [Phoenix dactylifera]XP_008805727.1 uncharacterized protein LOC103718605 [Phoenix dactylifera]
MLRMEDELVTPHIDSEDGKTEVTVASMDIEPSVDEDNKMLESPVKGEIVASGGVADLEPYEGMEFESEEAARAFYAAYARHVGFRIRISRYTRSRRDNSIISRRIVCSKEGFREARANEGLFDEQRQRQRAVTRVGCKAMIMVKKIGPEKWIVTKFVKEHNHGPVPPRKVEVRTGRRDDDLLVQSYISDGGAVQEPYEGMEFDSEEAAKAFYITYARHLGFRARISKYCRSRRDNSIISRQIVCSKEGFREVRVKNEITDEGKTKRPRLITRIGCKAMIIVKKANSGKWVVTKFEKEHNHSLASLKMPCLESRSNAGKVINLQGAITKPNGMVTDESCAGTQGTSRESLTVLYNQLCCEAIKYAQEGAATEDSYNVAMSALKEAVEKVAAAKRGAVTVAQQGLAIGGARQAFLIAHPAQTKALQDLQCLNEVKQVPLILNIANGRLLHNRSDDGLIGNGSEGSDLPAERKMAMQIVNRDVELDAGVQKFQNQDSATAAEAASTSRSGCYNLTSPGSSETQMVAIPAVPMTVYMPVMGSLPASCSVATPGTSGGSYTLVAAPIEALPVSARPAGPNPQIQDAPLQPAAASQSVLVLSPSPGNLLEHCKSYSGPNPQVHATALACGARVVSPKAAASLIKAIEAKIRSGSASVAKSALAGGCKLLSIQSPRPRAIEEGKSEHAPANAIHKSQAESLEEMKLQTIDMMPRELVVDPDHSGAENAGQNGSLFEKQIELLDTAGAAEDLSMFEKRAWTEIKCD